MYSVILYHPLYMPISNSVLCKTYMWLVHVSPSILTVLTKGQVSPTQNDNTAVVVGVFASGIAVGAVTVLLVAGIVCGVCKLTRHPKQPTSNEPPSK